MKNTKDNEREIADFERNFKREFFKKIPKHNIYNQTLDALFKVFKEINLYDYFSLGRLMDVITTLNIKYLPTEVLHEMNGEAIYEIFTNTIMINDKFLNKPKYIEDFIHELTHSISAFYKISNEKNNFISNKYKYFDYHNGNEESLGIFPIAITKIDLEKDEEINNYINTMDYKLCKDLYKKYTSYNEGVTEVFTMLVKSKFIRSRLNYAVVIHVKVAEMFCKIFGNKVWESYFTNSFKPILEKLNIPPENIMEIIS